MLEREWVCRKQAIACQFGYSISHVATVNYVIEVCLYPRLLPSSVRSPLLSPDLYLRTVHLVPHRLSRVESTFCGHEEHEREQPVLRTRLGSHRGGVCAFCLSVQGPSASDPVFLPPSVHGPSAVGAKGKIDPS